MKNMLLSLFSFCALSCVDINTPHTQASDVVLTPVDSIEYIVMPEVVIVANSEVQQQEIIFTETEVKDSFEDPTAYGAQTFCSVFVA